MAKNDLMHMIDRRATLAAFALLPLCSAARAGIPEQINIDADEGRIVVTRYAADGIDKRASVLLLHGLHGFERRLRAYERYCSALTAGGIDAYLLRYLTAEDAEFFNSRTTDQRRREAHEARRFDDWAKRVSTVVTAISARPDSSHRIGLLGFHSAASLRPIPPRATNASVRWPCCMAACRPRWLQASIICHR